MNIAPQPQVPVQEMQPVGPNATAWARVRHGNPQTIKDAQQFLTMHGYKLSIDGKWGPHTALALKGYFRNSNPHQINQMIAQMQRQAPAPKRYAPPSNNAPLQTLGPKTGNRGAAPRGKGKGGGGGGGGGAPVGGPPMPNVGGPYDPKKIAASMVNAEYNPAINQLQNLLGDVGNQDKYNQGQLHGYYQQMKNLAAGQSADQASQTQAQEQQIAQILGNNAQLFGGANASAMQPAVGNAEGFIGAEGASQQGYLDALKPLLDAQAAQGTANEQGAARAQQQNYQNQLASQQHAKGQAYQSAYQQAISSQAQQEQNQLALQEAQSMLPYKVQAAKYGAQAAKYGVQSAKVSAQYAPANAKYAIQGKQAELKHYQALTTQEMASAKKQIAQAKAAGQGTKAANVLAPGSTTAERIQSGLYKAMTNGKGKIVIPNPMLAQRALFQNAIQQGLIDRQGRPLVPGAVRLLNSTLLNMYNRDAAWQANYKWNGRSFVAKG